MVDTMDLKVYTENLKKAIEGIKSQRFLNTILVPPSLKLLATIKNRIQKEGKNSEGGNIGDYSTNPIYVTRDKFVKKSSFKPRERGHIATSQKLGKYNPKTKQF